MHITVRFVNPGDGQVEEATYTSEEFIEIKYHDLFDEETSEIIDSSPGGITDLSLLDNLSSQIDEIGEGPVEAWIENQHGYTGEDIAGLYLGKYDSVEDYARRLAEEQWNVPEELGEYIDWEAYANDTVSLGDYDVLPAEKWMVYIFAS